MRRRRHDDPFADVADLIMDRGWYADPDDPDRERFWDGEQVTERTRAAARSRTERRSARRTSAPPSLPTGQAADTHFASWRERAWSYLLDWACMFALVMLVIAAMSALPRGYGLEAPAIYAFIVLWFIGPTLYHTVFEGSSWQATPGKRLLGHHVARAEDGGRVGYGRAFVRAAARYLVSLVSVGTGGLLLVANYLWPIWDFRKQTFHDKMAGTVVVRGR